VHHLNCSKSQVQDSLNHLAIFSENPQLMAGWINTHRLEEGEQESRDSYQNHQTHNNAARETTTTHTSLNDCRRLEPDTETMMSSWCIMKSGSSCCWYGKYARLSAMYISSFRGVFYTRAHAEQATATQWSNSNRTQLHNECCETCIGELTE